MKWRHRGMGPEVARKGRDELLVDFGSRKITVYAELQVGTPKRLVDLRGNVHWDGNPGALLSSEEKDELRAILRTYFTEVGESFGEF